MMQRRHSKLGTGNEEAVKKTPNAWSARRQKERGEQDAVGGDEREAVREGVVSALEADPKRVSMYRIEVQAADGTFAELLSVHEDTLVGMRLLKGRRLSPEEWKRLRQSGEVELAYRSALGMLDRKARTRKELEAALKRKSYSAEAIAACLDRLTSHRLIDDTAYAKRFAEQKVTGQKKGTRLIRQELRQRGVAQNDVEQALSALDGEAERESALALARKRWPTVKGATKREREHKLMAVLQRRGFPGGLALDAVRQASSEAADRESGGMYGDDEWEPYDSGDWTPDED